MTVPTRVARACAHSQPRPGDVRGSYLGHTPSAGYRRALAGGRGGQSAIGRLNAIEGRWLAGEAAGARWGLAVFEGGEAFAGHGGFFGAGEVVDKVLQAGLRLRGLFQIDQGQGFLV